MQEPNHIQSDVKNPYIQILFNINSKNVVNNNILSQREKQIQFQLPHQLKPQKIDKNFIFPNKKQNQQNKYKNKSKNINKSLISSNKLNNLNSQQTCRNKKKTSLIKNEKNSCTDTQKSVKQFKPKKKLSNGLLTPNCQQNELFSSSKKQNKLSKQKIRTSKDLRQKVIQLMIKDYQKGIISAKNFKEAISSLIQQQSINKKSNNKSQIKTEKSKSNFTNTYRNSLGTSLRNTPRHKPSKSKSQKFYHAFEKDSKSHQNHNNIQKQFDEESFQSPRIVETIIDRKQFVNKIIIKGINTSLFLSNQLIDKDSPTKRDIVQVAVINTSDSVRQLRTQMQKTIKQSVVTNNYPQDSFKKHKKQESRNSHIQKNTNFSSQKQQAVLKIQTAWKKYRTKKILSHIMQEIECQQQNNLYYSRLNFSDNKQEQSLQSFQPESSKNIQQKSQIYVETSNQLIKIQNQFDQFQIREDFEQSQNYSKIQQLQKQYALILKDNNDSKYLSSRQYSNSYFKQKKSSNIQNQKQMAKNQLNTIKNYESNGLNQIEQFKFKPYLSSEIQINSTLNKNLGLENIKNQEINKKKVNMIKSNQIKKLNQILDIVKNQLNRNGTIEVEKQKQDENKKIITRSNPFILQKIASILENQRDSLQNQLKIYEKQYKRPSSNDKAQSELFQKIKKKQQRENFQVINSFKKKIDNKKKQLLKYQQPQGSLSQSSNQKPSFLNNFNTQQLKLLNSSSGKSLRSSSTYSNHLQKTKISQLNLDYIQIALKKRLYNITLKKQQNMCAITQKFINDKLSAKQYQEQKQIIEKWFKLQQNELKKTKSKLCSQYKKAKEFLYKDDITYTNKLTKQKSYKMIKCISEKYLEKLESKINDKNRRICNDSHIDVYEKENQKICKQEIIRNTKNARQPKKSSNRSKKKLQQQAQFQKIQHQRIQKIQRQLLQIQIRNKLSGIQQKSKMDQLSSPQFVLARSKVQNQIQYLRSSSQILNNGSKRIEQKLKISRPQSQKLQLSLIISVNYEQNQSAPLYSYKNSVIDHNSNNNQSPNKPSQLIKLKSQISHFLDKYEQQCLNQNNLQQQQLQEQEQIQQQELEQIQEQKYLQQQLYNQQQQYQGQNQQQQQQSDNQQQSQNENQLETYQKNIINYLSDDEEAEYPQYQQLDVDEVYNKNFKSQPANQLDIKQNQHDLNIIVNRKTENLKINYPNENLQSKYDKQTLLFSPPRNKFKQQFSDQLLAYEEVHQNQNQQLNYPENSQNGTRLLLENGQNQSVYFKQNKQSKSQNSQQCIKILNQQQILASKGVQLSHRKLKYLNQQDKDDIFQFMFLDLCLQLFLQQTKNNKIMKCIQRYILNLRKKRKIPKGFKTNLITSKSYIQNLTQFIKSNHSQQLKRLQFPMGPSAKQMLKFMRDYNDDSDEDQQIETVNLILNINIYQSYDLLPINKLALERYYDDDQKQESRVKFLNTLKHIHNKAIFDSLNESLDIQRSYGIWGKPFPWKKSLILDRLFNQAQLKTKLAKASQKVVQNCSYLCGVMIDKQDSVFGKTNISQQYLNHIREDRMSKMLSNDMVDNQDRWIFYDDQETEVLMEISKYISRTLFQQFTKQVQSFNFRLQKSK